LAQPLRHTWEINSIVMNDFSNKASEIIAAGKILYQMGMVPATSGNFSARLENGDIAITVSGAHKGNLTESDIMIIDSNGKPRDDRRPSAETGLHVQIYQRFPDTGAILHPHAKNAVLLTRASRDRVTLNNYEILKAFPGITTHESTVDIPVFDNDQDIPRLASRVEAYMSTHSETIAYIIAGHGFYTWGKSMTDALRHVEALDYMLACELEIERNTH